MSVSSVSPLIQSQVLRRSISTNRITYPSKNTFSSSSSSVLVLVATVLLLIILCCSIEQVSARSDADSHTAAYYQSLVNTLALEDDSSTCGDCGTRYVCKNSTCSNCTNSEECSGTLSCVGHSDGSATCERLNIFPDFTWRDALTTIIFFFGAALAAGGGLGGGAIFVPILVLVSGFSTQDAVSISQAMIFGGAIINFIKNMTSQHPTDPKRPLIDFDATIILEPTLLVGTVIGVLLNGISPNWLISVLLVLLTSLMVYRTYKKGIAQWKKEKKSFATSPSTAVNAVSTIDISSDSSSPVTIGQTPSSSVSINNNDGSLSNSFSQSQEELIEELIEEQPPKSKWELVYKPLCIVIIIWVIVLLFSIARGGRSGSSSLLGVTLCSGVFWGLTASLFVLLLVIAVGIAYYLIKRYHRRLLQGRNETVEGDVNWNTRNIVKFAVFAFLAGLLGSFLGLGGGMIIGPVLLEMGMQSQIASATSAMTVLITSSSAVIQYILIDKLPLSHGAWYFLIGIISTYFGQTVIGYLVKKYQRTSIIIFSVTILLAIAAVIMVVFGVLSTLSDLKYGKTMGFKSYC